MQGRQARNGRQRELLPLLIGAERAQTRGVRGQRVQRRVVTQLSKRCRRRRTDIGIFLVVLETTAEGLARAEGMTLGERSHGCASHAHRGIGERFDQRAVDPVSGGRAREQPDRLSLHEGPALSWEEIKRSADGRDRRSAAWGCGESCLSNPRVGVTLGIGPRTVRAGDPDGELRGARSNGGVGIVSHRLPDTPRRGGVSASRQDRKGLKNKVSDTKAGRATPELREQRLALRGGLGDAFAGGAHDLETGAGRAPRVGEKRAE